MKLSTHISKYINPKQIHFFKAKDKTHAIEFLERKCSLADLYPQQTPFLQALEEREQLTSTGIGEGVAIPHAKLPIIPNLFLTIGILEEGIEWDALDGMLVRLVFMIGGPPKHQSEYLQLLSKLTYLIRHEDSRNAFLTSKSPQNVLHLIERFSQ